MDPVSADLAAQAMREHLSSEFPGAAFTVSTDLFGGTRERVIVQWLDLPTSDVVYSAAHRAVDHFTSAQRGWKLVLRNWPSRRMRLAARAEIRKTYPAFDYITHTGDTNPDSVYRYRRMQIFVGDVLVADDKASVDRFVKLVANELLRQAAA